MCLRTMRPGLGNVSYGFAGTIVPDDERERLVELDDVGIVRTEAPNALYQHLHDTVMPIRLLRPEQYDLRSTEHRVHPRTLTVY